MKYLFLLFFIAMLGVSCQPKPAEQDSVEVDITTENEMPAEYQAMEDQIMKIHDEVMPKMSDINSLSTQLKDIRDKAGKDAAGNPVKIGGLDEAILELEKAEQWMMDWMKNYSETKNKLAPEHMGKFYEKELMKVDNVKSTMLNAIDQANAWLAAHPAG